MKKQYNKCFTVFLAFILVISITLNIVGCNKQIFDTTYSFTYAYVELPNGECVEGKVQSWKDFEDGDQLQVKIDGKVYLTNSTRIVLIAE